MMMRRRMKKKTKMKKMKEENKDYLKKVENKQKLKELKRKRNNLKRNIIRWVVFSI